VIEAALVLPLVLLLVFGILEFGWMFLVLQQVTHGARAGARLAVTADATTASVLAAVQDMMTDRGIGGLEPVEISPAGEVADLDSGTVVTVTVKVRYADVGLKIPLLAAFAPTFLRASVSMAKEGP
jgi:Flp pilus assembly protein TadG